MFVAPNLVSVCGAADVHEMEMIGGAFSGINSPNHVAATMVLTSGAILHASGLRPQADDCVKRRVNAERHPETIEDLSSVLERASGFGLTKILGIEVFKEEPWEKHFFAKAIVLLLGQYGGASMPDYLVVKGHMEQEELCALFAATQIPLFFQYRHFGDGEKAKTDLAQLSVLYQWGGLKGILFDESCGTGSEPSLDKLLNAIRVAKLLYPDILTIVAGGLGRAGSADLISAVRAEVGEISTDMESGARTRSGEMTPRSVKSALRLVKPGLM